MSKSKQNSPSDDEPEIPVNEVPNLALQLLNAHGLAFQQSVIRLLSSTFKTNDIPLYYCTQEFPVSVGNETSRIDLVFASRNRSIYFLGECKRSDPRCAHWFFFRSGDHSSEATPNQIMLEQVSFQRRRGKAEGSSVVSASGAAIRSAWPIYSIACEGNQREPLKKQVGKAGQSIEAACSQLSVGISGFVEHLSHIFSRDGLMPVIQLLPVLFTTATLWTSDADISDAEYASGTLNNLSPALRQVPWLLYEYTLSPGVKHMLSWTAYPAGEYPGWLGPHTHDFLLQALDLEATSRGEFRRTVAVVRPEGLLGFLELLRRVVPSGS